MRDVGRNRSAGKPANCFARILILAVLTLYCVSTDAQTRYFDDNSFYLLDLSDHMDVKFTWTIKGKLQVFMNEGINGYDEGNIPIAITNFDQLIKEDSSFWPAFYYRAMCKKNGGDLKGGEKDLLKVIQLNNKLMEAYLELGEIYLARKEYSKAKKYFEGGEDVAPKSVQPKYMLGILAYSRGELPKAAKLYDKCIELDPAFAPAYMYLGIIKYRSNGKEPEKNLELFNRSIQADSTFTPAYFWRALVFHGDRNNEGAYNDMNTLVRLMPDNALALTMRGLFLINLNRFDDAFLDFRKALTSRDVDENKYMSGQTSLINWSFVTTCPCRTTSANSRSKTFGGSETSSPPRCKIRSAAFIRNSPNSYKLLI